MSYALQTGFWIGVVMLIAYLIVRRLFGAHVRRERARGTHLVWVEAWAEDDPPEPYVPPLKPSTPAPGEAPHPPR